MLCIPLQMARLQKFGIAENASLYSGIFQPLVNFDFLVVLLLPHPNLLMYL